MRVVCCLLLLTAACDGSISETDVSDSGPGTIDGQAPDTGQPGPPPVPFEALPPSAALTKVKLLLTGLPPSSEELEAYTADRSVLRGMIDGWMTSPEFETQLKAMAGLLFQTNVDQLMLKDYFGILNGGNPINDFDRQGSRLSESILAGWPERVWQIVDGGEDFRQTMNTDVYMLNVPMMIAIAYADANPREDDGDLADSYIMERFPDMNVTGEEGTRIPLSESLDPSSENFMHFSYVRDWGDRPAAANCVDNLSSVLTARRNMLERAVGFLLGRPRQPCRIMTSFTAEDLELRPVRIVREDDIDQRTLFFDLDTLRTTDELRLGTERYGFHGDVGFQGYWLTNDGNEHRVTANQAIVVALGTNFNPEAVSSVADEAEADEMHADPTTACWGCHRGLDPMRDFFRHSYSAFGSERVASADNEPVPDTASFGVGLSEPVTGQGVKLFADTLFSHPDLANAWAFKVCRLANGFDCAVTDEEVTGAAAAFVESGYDFHVLLREVLASNSVTFQEATATWNLVGEAGVGTHPRQLLCLRLNLALGQDVCDHPRARNLIAAAPDWVFPRGDRSPTLSSRPALFFSAATERGCQAMAERALGDTDLPDTRDELAPFLVQTVMGLAPSDERSPMLTTILAEHYDEVAEASNNNRARMDTFMLACESPTAVSQGL